MGAADIKMIYGCFVAAASLGVGVSLGGLTKETFRQTGAGLLILRCGVALVIGADAGMALSLIIRMIDGKSGGNLWIMYAVLGIYVLTAAFLLIRRVSIFPKDSGVLFSANRVQQRRFISCLVQLFVWLVFYGAWLGFLLGNDERMPQVLRVVSCIFVFPGLAGMLWNGRQSIRLAYERLETIIDQQYQAELLNFMQVIRSQRHDFNFHMQAVAGLIENDQYDECRQYVRTMVKNVEHLNALMPLKDPAVSALMNTFQEIANSRQIRLSVTIQDQLEDIPCTIYEINTVIGNLLQNAIDEAEGKASELRWISLLTVKRGRQHIIKVSNPCEKSPEEFAQIFRPGYSTKHSHEGIGLATVRKIVRKYGGTVYLEHDPGIVHFIVKLPLKYKARG